MQSQDTEWENKLYEKRFTQIHVPTHENSRATTCSKISTELQENQRSYNLYIYPYIMPNPIFQNIYHAKLPLKNVILNMTGEKMDPK